MRRGPETGSTRAEILFGVRAGSAHTGVVETDDTTVGLGVGVQASDAIVERAELPDGRSIIVRRGLPDDADELRTLYERLSEDDLWLRFFTAAAPPPSFFAQWLSSEARGGLVLVAFVEERSGRRTLVAEAGYSMQEDGDGELGITVDPLWRGWVGPWLLAVLLREAAACGVVNVQAVVQLANRRMLALLRHRGSAVVEHAQPSEIRVVVSTTGRTPGWPPTSGKPRILVEARSGRWAGEDAARAAGFDVRTCRGPNVVGSCPVLAGERCPLVEGADAVVVLLGPAEPTTATLLDAHAHRADLDVVVPAFGAAGADASAEPAEVIAGIRRAIGLA